MHKYLGKTSKISRHGARARKDAETAARRGMRYAAVRAALYALAGLGAGLLNGLLGAAGGILLVTVLPVLPRLFAEDAAPQDRRDVLATSMAVMLPVSVVSLILYFLRGLQPPTELLSAIWLPSLIGGLIGAWLLDRLPVRTVKILFALLVLVSGVRMVFG